MSRHSRSALIVSDSAPLRQYTASILGAVGVAAAEAASGFQAMDRLAERSFDFYVVDLDMPSSDGLAIFAISLTGGVRGPSPAVIGLTAGEEDSTKPGPWGEATLLARLPKPFHPDELVAAAQAILKSLG
ncbi:MAG TPA: response regulator [Hyphomonadaceae bacterium]|nr:response regulator [Hyphomonadaceae bacterium]